MDDDQVPTLALATDEERLAQRLAATFGDGDPVADFRPLFAHVRQQRPTDTAARIKLPPGVARKLDATGRDWRHELEVMAIGFGFATLTLEVPEPVAGMDGPAVLPEPEDQAEWARVIARLQAAGASTITVGQCEHGWVASCKVQKGRATVAVEAHGEPTRLAVCTLLAELALGAGDGKRRRSLPTKARRRKGKR